MPLFKNSNPGLFKKFLYYGKKFPKYGLYYDDIRTVDSAGVLLEAVNRLPEEVRDARRFRICRAMMLSTKKELLPKEQWTPLDADHRYLTETLEKVRKERAMKENYRRK